LLRQHLELCNQAVRPIADREKELHHLARHPLYRRPLEAVATIDQRSAYLSRALTEPQSQREQAGKQQASGFNRFEGSAAADPERAASALPCEPRGARKLFLMRFRA